MNSVKAPEGLVGTCILQHQRVAVFITRTTWIKWVLLIYKASVGGGVVSFHLWCFILFYLTAQMLLPDLNAFCFILWREMGCDENVTPSKQMSKCALRMQRRAQRSVFVHVCVWEGTGDRGDNRKRQRPCLHTSTLWRYCLLLFARWRFSFVLPWSSQTVAVTWFK